MRARRLPQWLDWILSPYGLLRCVGLFRVDVSGLPIDTVFKGQVSKKELGHLTLEDGINKQSRNVDSEPTYAAL
jgi:hypothetical protein